MVLTVSSRHMEVTSAMKSYALEKAHKLLKFDDRISEIEVVFDATRDSARVEMIVHTEHRNMFVAHQNSDDAYAGIDGCVDKLERQLSDHHQKYRNRKHPAATDRRTARRSGPGKG